MSGRRELALLGGEPLYSKPLYLTRPLVPDEARFHELIATIFRNRWFTNDGEMLRELEKRLALRLGVDSCTTFCNATIALQVALRSLDLRGEVITSPFTFPATVHAIEWTGLTPVFCDIDPATYNFDPASAAEWIGANTCALLPVHVFGNPCDVVGIEKLAGARGLRVVYDAAHAFAVSHLGRPIGVWGDLSVFSFHATKLFHTAEGGAVVGGDPDRLKLLRNFGILNEEVVRGSGLNGKLSELHAAMGLTVLEKVDEEIAARGRLTQAYRERLEDLPGVHFQRTPADHVPNNGYFSLEIDADEFGLSRDQVHRTLRAENILCRKYFFPLCSENEAYRHLPSADPARLPNAHRLAARILCLPLFGDLGMDNLERIAECVRAARAGAERIRRETALR